LWSCACSGAGPSGSPTNTGIEPAVLMSSLVTAPASRVALTTVVASAWPFQNTVDPETKPLPSTVRVKPGPPAVAVFGVSVVIAGAAGPLVRAQLAWITA